MTRRFPFMDMGAADKLVARRLGLSARQPRATALPQPMLPALDSSAGDRRRGRRAPSTRNAALRSVQRSLRHEQPHPDAYLRGDLATALHVIRQSAQDR
jgi:hypothetical protein